MLRSTARNLLRKPIHRATTIITRHEASTSVPVPTSTVVEPSPNILRPTNDNANESTPGDRNASKNPSPLPKNRHTFSIHTDTSTTIHPPPPSHPHPSSHRARRKVYRTTLASKENDFPPRGQLKAAHHRVLAAKEARSKQRRTWRLFLVAGDYTKKNMTWNGPLASQYCQDVLNNREPLQELAENLDQAPPNPNPNPNPLLIHNSSRQKAKPHNQGMNNLRTLSRQHASTLPKVDTELRLESLFGPSSLPRSVPASGIPASFFTG
ncbi:hypothetical protein SISSUDRAFT_1068056 [Sistotremastrum suecicum HHB10207 ss-3]|uniref:Uncharacterized protein n=1 Tax=Sistotremastrum suecicum HHB10207 ss-3 TaxID=1314776 RepID=A0A165WGQ6_9AGAM|nr:hypothetical protein SISSUDRAFT_1068056 [Sistotremastrum suecicum HHB10207 ss-3]